MMSVADNKIQTKTPKEVSRYFEVIPDVAAFMDADQQSLEFPLTISQLAKAAQTTVHTVRNYVVENLIHCHEHSPGGFALYDQCALNRLRFIRAARRGRQAC